MRQLVFVLAVMAQLASAHPALCRDEHDHLALLNRKLFARYRQILTSHLAGTPFDRGRVIVCPAFEPEYSISIYNSGGSTARATYRVTYLSAKESIWGLTNGGNDLSQTKKIKVRRMDADIPESTAALLKQVWARMLGHAHGQAPPTGEWGRIPFDSTSVEWYLQMPNGGASSAELNNYFPIGRNTQSFVKLTTETLLRYCKADAKERDAIARTIETSARKLLAATSED